VLDEPKTLSSALPSCLVAEGLHDACLVTVRRFENAHGPRVGFEFGLMGGERLLASAVPSTNPQSKLAELLRGLLGRDPVSEELEDPMRLAGTRCKVLVRTETNKSGRTYSNVVTVFR
jgi:hypothetical protein